MSAPGPALREDSLLTRARTKTVEIATPMLVVSVAVAAALIVLSVAGDWVLMGIILLREKHLLAKGICVAGILVGVFLIA